MLIQYCSDLHLEFPVNKKYLNANPVKPEGEILLLGGDIIPFAGLKKRTTSSISFQTASNIPIGFLAITNTTVQTS